ncbi:hypothetical protein [Nonomuraea sp. NPDC049695]|uniref:hypothetical protein n=1 Tax=Nonomuraea sp. NPDC049695 TaxID=3154734 RepID=UPI00342DFAE3
MTVRSSWARQISYSHHRATKGRNSEQTATAGYIPTTLDPHEAALALVAVAEGLAAYVLTDVALTVTARERVTAIADSSSGLADASRVHRAL